MASCARRIHHAVQARHGGDNEPIFILIELTLTSARTNLCLLCRSHLIRVHRRGRTRAQDALQVFCEIGLQEALNKIRRFVIGFCDRLTIVARFDDCIQVPVTRIEPNLGAACRWACLYCGVHVCVEQIERMSNDFFLSTPPALKT